MRPLARCLPLLLPLLTLPVVALAPTASTAVDAPTVRINEVESNGDVVGDWIEIVNTGSSTVDVSGWTVLDNDGTHTPLAFVSGSTLAPGGYLSIYTEPAGGGGFGLGGADSARLFSDAAGTTLVDSYNWTTHASTTYGRCPDGTGAFATTTTSTRGAANACPPVFSPAAVKINEVESNGDSVGDWVELVNTSGAPGDISGWKLVDNDSSHPFAVVPNGTVIAPGGFYSIYTEFPPPGFGLGSADSATLYQADGTSLVDSYAWTSHAATTYGRCPDGTGAFRTTTVATRGAANACSPVRLNEIESSDPASGPDFVELVNLSNVPVDLTGWVIKDSGEADATTLPTGTTLPANGRLLVDTLLAGLGSSDSARLFDPSNALIDSYSWTSHATTTYGRCADGVGAFTTTSTATPGAANDCPGLRTEPWPGSQVVRTSDLTETFVQDASGVVFEPTDPTKLWVAQNKLGTLRLLTKQGDTWIPAAGWAEGRNPRYVDGTGSPDTEGVTIGPDGAVYLASERNNDVSGVSRNSILRYVPATSMSATDEWDLTTLLPTVGANLGLEGITFIPDAALVAQGFVDPTTTSAYDPSRYPDSGLYAVAVEGTGKVYLLALPQTSATAESAQLVATVDPKLLSKAGPAAAMDVAWDPELQRLRVLCDDSCDGTSVTMKVGPTGAFVVDKAYDRPAGMPNLNNEGLAIAPQSTCANGVKEAVWSDDGDTDGHSLRSGTVPCTAPPIPVPAVTNSARPAITGTAQVGRSLTATGGTWSPSSAELSYQWMADGAPLAGATSPTLVVPTDARGKVVTVRVTASAPGYTSQSALSDPTAAVTPGEITTVSPPTISGATTVGSTLTSAVGTFDPSTASVTRQWLADGSPVPGATGETLVLGSSQIGTTISLRVTAVAPGYVDKVVTSTPTGRVQGVIQSVEPPTTSGEPRVGQTLTATSGTWSPSPATTRFQWSADGTDIAGATSPSLVLGPELVGRTITVRVTAARPDHVEAVATSAPTTPVAPGDLTLTSASRLAGRARAKETIRVQVGAVDPTATTVLVRWLVGGSPVKGETGRSLELRRKWVGDQVRAEVTYQREGYVDLPERTASVEVEDKAKRQAGRQAP